MSYCTLYIQLHKVQHKNKVVDNIGAVGEENYYFGSVSAYIASENGVICIVSWPRVSFRLRKKFPTSGIIPELGIQFPMSGKSSELLPDIGKRFPMSGNSFRYRKTVSDVRKQFPVSGNGFRCRGTVPIPELLLDVRKPFAMSENDFFRYWETVYAVGNISIALNRSARSKRADYTIDLVKSA